MKRSSIDFGSFSQWRGNDETGITKDIGIESGSDRGPQRVDTSRLVRDLGLHPVQRSLHQSKNSKKKVQRPPHRDIETTLPEELRAKILIESILDTERNRLIAEGDNEKLCAYDEASKSITSFKQKIADGSAEIESTVEAAPQPHPNDLELEVHEKQLKNMIREYELEIAEWESLQNGTHECFKNTVEEIEKAGEVHAETEIDEDDVLSKEVESALGSYAIQVEVLNKDMKVFEKENNSTRAHVQSIATNIISRYNK